ncbi:MAG: 30S ribosomal protein S9 [Gemmatimonadota bacterium]|jgi:small subunit ribosomal protein S9
MATKVEQQHHGVGRRKTSVARVYLRPGRGSWSINGRELGDYFPRHSHQQHASGPLAATENEGTWDVHVVVTGGGKTGQAGAVRLGLARALLELDPEYRGVLRDRGMLTRDPRQVERKKPGQPKARKRFQFSKR